ncbi:hypothetical protein QUF99_15010 [Bacillus sp. DX4.1]|uniref:hypothetical protein n=1 Tax=Bacillus sp. DX4.1 TaxID=3055867 RepID=UPI0025A2ED23|nr:hypothetical protein [Bacillus sp. DX4.1]MDM5188578.1 hypothetical protein [Bacillus sp. DX4.1]
MKVAEEYGVDRRNYKPPVRRKRTINEMLRSDTTKSRNKERVAKYREFIRVQPIMNYVVREEIVK